MTVPALQVDHVTVRFGGLLALSEVSLTVAAGSRHGILGPNGAGKTTLFNVITGLLPAESGRIFINGQEATRLPAHRRVGLGLVRTFQITTLFPNLTALENVLLASQVSQGQSRSLWRETRQDGPAKMAAETLLAGLNLAHLAQAPVRDIGYGEQRQLEIALALALRPKILLLDEPTAGLSVAETRAVTQLIRNLPQDLTLVLIEHDLEVIFAVADHLTVLYYGESIAGGPAAVIREDPVVKEVYLGEE